MLGLQVRRAFQRHRPADVIVRGVDIGRGEEEGVSNVKEISESAASKSLEVLKQISSSGYLRKRVPQELVVLQGGQAMGFARPSDPSAALATLVPEAASPVATRSETSSVAMTASTKAKMQGFEGEACGECGNYTLVRNGTCMKCNTCGGTSGCS
jgi:ribonucleoside-diphosphate reductase alpha chain